MSFGERLGNGASGAVSGFQTGLDLYAKYSEIKAQDDQRQRQQKITDGITGMVQNGELKDPLEASKKIAQLHLSVGDTDGYMKYTQAAQGMQKVKQDQLGMQAYTQAQVDPYGAIDTLNQFNQLVGNGNQFSYEKTPSGIIVHSKGPQGQTSVDYTDPDHFKHDVMKYLEPWVLGPEKALTVPAEVAKDQAQTRQAEQATWASEALLPGQIGVQQAQIGSANAAAANSASERAARTAMTPINIEARRAEIAAAQAQTENTKADNTREDAKFKLQLEDAPIDRDLKTAQAAKARKDAEGSVSDALTKLIPNTTPDLDGWVPPERDPATVGPLAISMQKTMGGDSESNISIAARWLGTDGLKFGRGADEGKIKDPATGKVTDIGKNAAAILERAMKAKAEHAGAMAQ